MKDLKTLSLKNKILLSSLALFIIQALLTLKQGGPYIFSDETCAINVAKNLANNFEYNDCTSIIGITANDHLPLFQILIAPLYWFFSTQFAYKAILILNCLLISSLIFPLTKIIGEVNKKLKENTSIILSCFVLFLPQIIFYQNTALTESLFIFLNIWTLYFYLISKGPRSNIMAFTLAIGAALTRPFGFITLLAIIITEAWNLKDKKKLALIYLPLSIITTTVFISQTYPDIRELINNTFTIFKNDAISSHLLRANIEQFNTILIASSIVPFYFFLKFLGNKSQNSKMRLFLGVLFTLNIIVTLRHILGYISIADLDPGLLSRYINISLIYIFLIGAASIFSHKLKRKDFLLLILMASILLLQPILSAKHSLNIDLSYLLTNSNNVDNTTQLSLNHHGFSSYLYPILAIFTLLWVLASRLKPTKALATIAIVIILQATLSYNCIFTNTSYSSEIEDYFINNSHKIIFLDSADSQIPNNFDFWKLISQSDNQISYNLIINYEKFKEDSSKIDEMINSYSTEYEYIISPLSFDLPIIVTQGAVNVYEI
jgi:hypothetical protein